MPGSVVTVQLGQCGNQVGAELFDTLSAEIDAHPPRDRAGIRRAFFREPHRDEHDADVSGASTSYMAPVARAVLIDMEPKVVQASLRRARRTGRWRYDGDRTLAFQSGSGNNWARGYHTYGDAVRHDVLDLVAKEAEACDHVGGFMLMQSMAGGTGAGLGARVAEALRDEYPTATLMNHCVWPYESGEVIVQAYNTLLTLSSLLDSSDGVTVVQNEELHQTCVKLLGVERPTFGDMNAVAASQLAGVLLPAARRDAAGGVPGGGGSGRRLANLHDLSMDLCCHAKTRLLSLRQTPTMPPKSVEFTTFQWPSLLKRARQMLLTGTTLEEGLDWGLEPGANMTRAAGRVATRSIASMLFLRGKDADVADATPMADPRLYPTWSPSPLTVAWSPTRFNGYEMCATTLTNCQTSCPPIGRMLARAYQMRDAGAYLHQYAEHGVGVDGFEEAFGRVEDVLAAYRTL